MNQLSLKVIEITSTSLLQISYKMGFGKKGGYIQYSKPLNHENFTFSRLPREGEKRFTEELLEPNLTLLILVTIC